MWIRLNVGWMNQMLPQRSIFSRNSLPNSIRNPSLQHMGLNVCQSNHLTIFWKQKHVYLKRQSSIYNLIKIWLYMYCEYKLIRSIFLLSKMHLFWNKMKEQINQSIVFRWLRLFPISQAIFEFHMEKMMRLLRRSTNRTIFWLLHKSENAEEPSPVPSIETNVSEGITSGEYGGWGWDLPFQ